MYLAIQTVSQSNFGLHATNKLQITLRVPSPSGYKTEKYITGFFISFSCMPLKSLLYLLYMTFLFNSHKDQKRVTCKSKKKLSICLFAPMANYSQ